ncbi:MAG TPA: TrmH family RNA methyltransferase, partial [Polyangiaceae bacterium]
SAGMPLVATHPEGELAPEDLATLPRMALVLGNEREGIRPAIAAACAHRVRVPMRGFVESLNVSVTAAILLHAATRGRPGDLPEAERHRLYARGLYLSVPRAEDLLAHAG